MENQDQLPEEVVNAEQLQVGRNPNEQEEQQSEDGVEQEAGYTPGETEFADGEGTRLDQKVEELEFDDDDDPEPEPESDEQEEPLIEEEDEELEFDDYEELEQDPDDDDLDEQSRRSGTDYT
ncbi:hypothetical protein [Pedobacter sp. V48]|uniref:hypothetical protein n=1 Tax=Pedobacter sp. V48 TaxID=509635 RepID=UPI0003E450FE|nr:hypothetical protein [Pedobacter sp. V48]ETZ23135.1 hypothetical protein N824_16885 [Pedobacter sp. V48]